jgi:hypothetical protein
MYSNDTDFPPNADAIMARICKDTLKIYSNSVWTIDESAQIISNIDPNAFNQCNADHFELIAHLLDGSIAAGEIKPIIDKPKILLKPLEVLEWAMNKDKKQSSDVRVFKLSDEALKWYSEQKKTKELTKPEREKLLTLVYGMAKDKYNYDPDNNRNEATGTGRHSIQAGLSRQGLTIDEGTIKKYLDEAKELFAEKNE